MESTSNQNEIQFNSTMFFERNSETKEEEILKRINSCFMNKFVKKENSTISENTNIISKNKMDLLSGFAITSGTDRAKKAVKLALSNLLFDELAFKNANSVLLLISSHLIETDLDEIGAINDYVQEKANYNANIMMAVSENEKLKEAIAITIILY